MNVNNIFVSIAAVFLTAIFTNADAAVIFGRRDCGQWMQARKNIDGKLASFAAETWLMGYLTGAVIHGNKPDPFRNVTSVEQVYFWMDKFCRDNPMKNIGDGGDQLILELSK